MISKKALLPAARRAYQVAEFVHATARDEASLAIKRSPCWHEPQLSLVVYAGPLQHGSIRQFHKAPISLLYLPLAGEVRLKMQGHAASNMVRVEVTGKV